MSAPSLEDFSTALADIVAAQSRSVVSVHSHRSRSSGFAWRPDLVITSDEALAEDGDLSVAFAGGEVCPARIVGRDVTTDIALLRVEGAACAPVSLDPQPIRAGAIALVIGASGGDALSALGSVAASGPAWRSIRGGQIDARIELDLQLRRAAQGGVAVEAGGRAFGMAVFGPRRRVLVIPAATIDRVATALLSHGRIARGFLGLGLQPVRVEGLESFGAIVTGVAKDGPAARAGARQGDVIVAWNGKPLQSFRSLFPSLGPDSVGQIVTIGLRRGGAPLDLPVTIGERPDT
jgi:S1-C subfamily serine protease